MVSLYKKAVIFLLLSISGFYTTMAQSPFASVVVNKNSVYVGEPVKITVTAYTPTYFTAPAQFANVQIKGAFSVFFKARPVSKIINKVRYSGIERVYNVFPYDKKNIELPSFEITITTPLGGGYQGTERVLKTKKRTVKVKPVPESFDEDKWLVASNVRVVENWKGNLKEVKVGDVIEQSIERTAYGTVAELILPIVWDSIPNVSLYPTRSSVENMKTETSISSKRIEGIRYLFEKEGEYTIPEREITWYNPSQKRLYKKTISGLQIKVLENPDLGMMQSMKDSLDVLNKTLKEKNAEEEVEEKEVTILGLSVKDFLIRLVLALIVLYYVVKYVKIFVNNYKEKRRIYLKSEAHFFGKFLKNIPSKNQQKILNTMYHWIDQLGLEQPTMHSLYNEVKDAKFLEEITSIENQLVSGNAKLKINSNVWVKVRKQYITQIKNPNENSDWINPEQLSK